MVVILAEYTNLGPPWGLIHVDMRGNALGRKASGDSYGHSRFKDDDSRDHDDEGGKFDGGLPMRENGPPICQ